MAQFPPLDRLVRKETALGTLRELQPPTDHIGSTVAPMMEVGSDDVIFDYAQGLTDGLAPARAEDAEAELAQKDLIGGGSGRASVIDWAMKDVYSASDVSRYRETLLIAQRLGANSLTLPLTVGSQIEDFRAKVARDDALRRRKLDNRLEWMRMNPLDTGGLSYNDGKISFSIDYGRPADQTDQAPTGGLFSLTTSDPIGAVKAAQRTVYERYGVKLGRIITSQKVVDSLVNSTKFVARLGMVVGGTPSSPIDLNYIVDGYGPDMLKTILERATNTRIDVYDAVYRTRAVGSNTVVNHRFTNEDKMYLLPDEASFADLDDAIGFAKVLTSPHPEGNWTPGFYEWEEDKKDPWGTVRGTGIKAFPVFVHLDWTYTMDVL